MELDAVVSDKERVAVALASPVAPVRPLLKWAGGKRQLLVALRRCYPDHFQRYIEPFVGSGAVFFDLYNTGALERRTARLTDVNPDLIGCYVAVRDRTEDVIASLAELEEDHRARGADCYYEVRERFNQRRGQTGVRPRNGATQGVESRRVRGADPELAAMFIYLNRTGFNGLYRLNRAGEFNVPAGRYPNPRICDAVHLRTVARALASAGVTAQCAGFDTALADAGPGDFVYCDPPYAPLTRTASFAHYTAGGFTPLDQIRLQKAVSAAAARGAMVVVSNSSAPEIEKAYRQAGLTVDRVPARRAINSRASLRGPIAELIIRNVKLKMAKAAPRAARVGAASA